MRGRVGEGMAEGGLSQRAFAGRAGVSRAVVRKGLDTGRVVKLDEASADGFADTAQPKIDGRGNGHAADDSLAVYRRHRAKREGSLAEAAELQVAKLRGVLEQEKRDVIEATLHEQGMRMRDATLRALDRAALGLLHQDNLGVVRAKLRAAYRDGLKLMDAARGGDGESAATDAASVEGAA